jgi:hypothetical protein
MDTLQLLARNLLELSQKNSSVVLTFENDTLLPSKELDEEIAEDLELSPVNREEVHDLILSLGFGQVNKKNKVQVYF